MAEVTKVMKMTRWCGIGFMVAVWFAMAGCSDAPKPAPDTRAADEKAIRDGETAWNADFKAKDAEKIVSHYADNAILMIPGGPPAKGKEAIGAALKSVLTDKNFALTFAAATVEVSKTGDLAYSQGAYAMTMTNPKNHKPLDEKGNFVTVYKKQADNSWAAIEDINTPEGSPAPVVTAKPARKASRRKK